MRRCALVVAALAGLLADTPPARAEGPPDYKLKPGATGKLCLSCHADFADKLAQKHVHTPVRAGDCADCHDPHASDHGKLLAQDPSAICATCHDAMVEPGATSAHRAVRDGQCVSCHDPHASEHESQLLRAGNTLCLGCHADLAGALASATHRHGPVDEDCLRCHDPHASREAPALLSKPVPALCVDCHSPKAPIFARAHRGYAVGDSDCTSCHDPHGSATDGLLWASVHAPVARGMCVQCHGPPDDTAPLSTERAGADLCRGCHGEVLGEILAKSRVHWPVLDGDGCARCHEPHASKVPGLLLAPPAELCGSCHADTQRRLARSKVRHEPVAQGECATCHAPHASDETYLLVATQPDLCGACHDWSKHTAHPLGPDAPDPRNRNLSIDCLTCHRTHGTPNDHLSHFEPRQELCMQCHTEVSR